jgi:hypothetical protein
LQCMYYKYITVVSAVLGKVPTEYFKYHHATLYNIAPQNTLISTS